MGKNYASPSAFRAALTQAAKNMSKKTGMSVSDLMKIFYFNRLAARVFTKEPDGWLIKGGQALLVRYRGAARLSQDIDLQCAQPERTAEEARELVIAAASLDLGDYLRFVPGRFLRHSDEGRGGAQYFTVFLGQTNVAAIKVDLVVGRTLAGTPEVRTLRSAVDIAWPVDWPEVRLYPVIDHIADKICALYERHGQNGEHGSNRYRDLADLLLISQQETVSGQAVCQALQREAERRRSLGTKVVLPATFEAPGSDWHVGYPEQAAIVLGLRGCSTFDEAATAAEAFINPMLNGTAHGLWNPRQGAWS
ncbi:nucleotidyl transferase AbiEii/AbiGii toxin family protein [Streptomyces griseoincarnatus]|uniref:nucleotidyl transferase AbiEii/AbiGii toxin family protein n=1 Tax=Streptomyces sp. SMS_SU21 TaxID=2069440 RepID=UPI001CD9417A|nr:nucleotidyl transferase AbiEii/AbiGii toxin family protein [Streptomyces sp. SMS_SU21]MCA2203306.1 nucleotidyl transferase AbiEii/AbiGii toxin family protein [Streptomyces sp. SMS_SU21]